MIKFEINPKIKKSKISHKNNRLLYLRKNQCLTSRKFASQDRILSDEQEIRETITLKIAIKETKIITDQEETLIIIKMKMKMNLVESLVIIISKEFI